MRTTIKVNADYESVLFQGNAGSPAINQSLEFLAFFLEDSPILTEKDYDQIYLYYVESIVGHPVQLTKKGPAENWWGRLENLDKEKWLNSKLTSAELNIKMGWGESWIVENSEEIRKIPEASFPLLSKDPFGMSGRGLKTIHSPNEKVSQKVVLEKLLHRKYDFSHYVFPDGKMICYQNLVDEKFQYKGTIFTDWKNATLEKLAFHSLAPAYKWEKFKSARRAIQEHFLGEYGYSIDSFMYEEAGEMKLKYLCEVNARKTMGLMTYHLAQKFSTHKKWVKLWLFSPHANIKKLRTEFETQDVIVLTNGDTRFDAVFLMAESEMAGKELEQAVNHCLVESLR